MVQKTPEDRAKKKIPNPLNTRNRQQIKFPRRLAWSTIAVLSSLGIAWGAPIVPTASGMQTLQQVYDYENRQLDKDYNQLFNASTPAARQHLSAQEIAWIQEKRAACGTVAKAQQSTQGLGCLIQHTDQRIVQIRQQEYGDNPSSAPTASTASTTSATAPTASTRSAVMLAPCSTPGTSASGGLHWNSMQSLEQYFKNHEATQPPKASAACPPNMCCTNTSALPEQQIDQTQCTTATTATAPTASTQSIPNINDCNFRPLRKKNRVNYSFIARQEGGLITEGYVPNNNGVVIGNSGVTIGIGVDLGQQTATGLASEGISSALIRKLKPYLGLKGKAAYSYLNMHPLSITEQQAQALTTPVEAKDVNTVASEYTESSSPPVNFFQLPRGAQTAIADLAYQYGPGLSTATPKYWQQVTHGDWMNALINLEHFGDAYPARRMKEAYLLDTDILDKKLPTTLTSVC